MQVSAPRDDAGEVRMVANPIRVSKTAIAHDVAPPRLGEHTDEVLGRLLGLDAATLAGLRERKIL